jgi:hypothetical protein
MHNENVSEKEPISADEGGKTGASLKIIINTQYNNEQ